MIRLLPFNQTMATLQRSNKVLPILTRRSPFLHPRKPLSSTGASPTITNSNSTITNSKNEPHNIIYGIIGGLVITIAGGIKFVKDEVGGLEGLQRTVSFYSLAVPAYGKYRVHMMLESPNETWVALDKDTSQKGLEKILELRGFYIKSGQMCAANIGNDECFYS